MEPLIRIWVLPGHLLGGKEQTGSLKKRSKTCFGGLLACFGKDDSFAGSMVGMEGRTSGIANNGTKAQVA